MKKIIIISVLTVLSLNLLAQNQDLSLNRVIRLNFINPAIEYQHPLSNKTMISTNIGWGFDGDYQELTGSNENGYKYLLLPFINVDYRFIYNRAKRLRKGRNIKFNAGNYLAMRMTYRAEETHSQGIYRPIKNDYSIGAVWGIQRSYARIHFAFDMGMSYYFDKENDGFNIFNTKLSIGLNLKEYK